MKSILALAATAAALVGTTRLVTSNVTEPREARSATATGPATATATATASRPGTGIALTPPPPAPTVATTTPALTWVGGRLGCTVITELPFTITRSGRYCLDRDLTTTSFYGIRIEATSALLDCLGHTVSASSPRSAGTDGIAMVGGAAHSTVHNCRVVGFDRGVTASAGSIGAKILNNSVDSAQSVGIGAWGDDAQVVGNRVTNTSPAEPGQYSNGITMYANSPEVAARRQVVARNVVANVYGSQQTTGIVLLGSAAPLIEGNSVIGLRPADGGYAIGLWLSDWAQGAQTSAARVVDNQLMTEFAAYSDFAWQDSVRSAAECSRNVSIGVAASNLSQCPMGTGNRIMR